MARPTTKMNNPRVFEEAREAVIKLETLSRFLTPAELLIDENYAGRSEMCQQFADLLHRALTHLQFPPRWVIGTAIYYDARASGLMHGCASPSN